MSLSRLPSHLLPFGGYGSPCKPPAVSFVDLADCRECDMCGGCETHEGCLTDLNHLDWFMQFASPGQTPCGEQHDRHQTTHTCALPAGHKGRFHMARTGDGWEMCRA